MKMPGTFLAAATLFFCLCGFTQAQEESAVGQPADERSAQDALPQSQHTVWRALAQCTVHLDQESYTYSIDYTPDVKALKGQRLTVSGFMLPLEAEEEFSHFLLSKRTPTCPFCPPGEPNEVIEVFTKEPVRATDELIFITGTMQFTSNPELGLFFQLKDADLKEPQ